VAYFFISRFCNPYGAFNWSFLCCSRCCWFYYNSIINTNIIVGTWSNSSYNFLYIYFNLGNRIDNFWYTSSFCNYKCYSNRPFLCGNRSFNVCSFIYIFCLGAWFNWSLAYFNILPLDSNNRNTCYSLGYACSIGNKFIRNY
jgi:hypothetical protein